ncbi:hypothetical protein HAX54_002638 [Datura stramonium]|uniref:Cytochrome P450 n=1 Tax=Datura stramonium TaxID=4076 RepID=A0ABS8T5R0_DATST|nr:hypothetical protein [Datura stramonium]
MNDAEICNNIVGLLVASYDTTSAAITFVLNYLAELPNIFNQKHKANATSQGALREAITDFTFEGFTIPKGWKSQKNSTLVDSKGVDQHPTVLYHLEEDQECVQEKKGPPA